MATVAVNSGSIKSLFQHIARHCSPNQSDMSRTILTKDEENYKHIFEDILANYFG